MARVDSIDIVAGVPNGGTGEVPSLGPVVDLITATNTKLDSVVAAVDTLETLIAATNTKLDTTITHQDGLETLLTTHSGYLDGVETAIAATNTAIASTNTKLDTIEISVDAVTTKLSADPSTQTTSAAILAAVDTLETLIAATNTKMDLVIGHVDDLESLLTTHSGYLDGVETAIAATNTKLDTLEISVDAVTSAIAGNIADGDVDAGNTAKVGGRQVASLSAATLDAAGDRAPFAQGLDRVQIVRTQAPLEDLLHGYVANTDGASTSVIASSGAGVKTYLTSIVIANSSTSDVRVEVKDGTTVKLSPMVPAKGDFVYNPPSPIAGTAATAWNVHAASATTTIYATFLGFKSKI